MRKSLIALLSAGALLIALFTGAGDSLGHLLVSAGLPSTAAMLIRDPAWRGAALYSAHRWTEAAENFRVSRSPDSDYNLGNAFAQAGLYARAIQAYDEALQRDPDDDDARSNRALVVGLLEARETITEQRVEGAANAGATSFGKKTSGAPSDSEAKSTGGSGRASGRETDAAGAAGGRGEPGRARQAQQDGARRREGASQGTGINAAVNRRGDGAPLTLLEDRARIENRNAAQSVQADRQWLAALSDEPGRFLKRRLAVEYARRVEAGTAAPIAGDPW